MSRTQKSLFDALGEASATASLLARVQASERVARVLSRLEVRTPGFDPLTPGSCELRDRTLHLRAASSAVAAKLRQSLPTMLAALQRQGIDLIEIKVRVQPGSAAYPNEGTQDPAAPEVLARRRASLAGARQLAEQLSHQLSDSPLREAVQKLGQTLKRMH